MHDVVKVILDTLKDNYSKEIIIPFRVKNEFHKNRDGIIKQLSKKSPIADERKVIDKDFNEILSLISKTKNKGKYIKRENGQFEPVMDSIYNYVSKKKSLILTEYNNSDSLVFKYSDQNDPILNFVNSFKTPFNPSNLDQMDMASKWSTRLSLGMKPGLTDATKTFDKNDEFSRCGDYFIWHEILRNDLHADEILFVTEESKGDWQAEKNKEDIDPFLEKEFKQVNGNDKKITFLWLNSFLFQYIIPLLDSEHAYIVAFITENKALFDEIFIGKKYADSIISEVAEDLIQNTIQHCIGQDRFCDVFELDNVEIEEIELINKDKVVYDYYPNSNELYQGCSLKIVGKCSIEVDDGYFDGEIMTCRFSNVPFSLAADCCCHFYFDGQVIRFNQIDQLEMSDLVLEKDKGHSQYDYDDYIDDGLNTCPDCGDILDEDNDAGNGFCKKCAPNH